MIPKIVFRTSKIYSDIVKQSRPLKLRKKYPEYEDIKKYAKAVEKLWRKEEEKVINLISKNMKLKWDSNKISCYIVGKGRNFAFPLTITCWKTKSDFLDVLTHELIHRLENEHQVHRKRWLAFLNKVYTKEASQTKTHLLLFAVHQKIYQEILSIQRMKRNEKRNDSQPAYAKAWELVKEKGPDRIIREFHQAFKEVTK